MADSRPLVWEMIRGGYEVIATLEQSAEDFEANAPEWSGPEWVTARISRSRWEADHAWQEKNRRGTADSQRSSPGGSGNSPRPCRRFMRQAGDRFSDLSLCPERTAQKNGCQFGRILTPCRTPDPALRPGSGGWIT